MAVELKSLAENASQVLTDIESKTNQSTPPLPIAYNRIVANAIAAQTLIGQMHNIDQRKECFPQTASENIGLPLWGELANRPRESGDSAELQVSGTGINDTVIGEGTLGPVLKGANGRLYDVKTGATIAGGVASIAIIDRLTGEEGTLTIGSELQLTTSVTGLDNIWTVTAINVAGSDQEDTEVWRSAIIQAVAFPPNIGTAAWFYMKALSVAGITRAYPYVDEDYPGRVLIYAVDDSKVDGEPSSSQLLAIEDEFTDADSDVMWATGLLPSSEKRIEAFASPIEDYNVEITEGTPALSATLKAALEIAINTYFATRNPYIKGLSIEDAGVVEKSQIVAVMQNTIDAEIGDTGRFDDIVLQKDGEVAANLYTLPAGTRAKAVISYT